jgi:hypothetical protein
MVKGIAGLFIVKVQEEVSDAYMSLCSAKRRFSHGLAAQLHGLGSLRGAVPTKHYVCMPTGSSVYQMLCMCMRAEQSECGLAYLSYRRDERQQIRRMAQSFEALELALSLGFSHSNFRCLKANYFR